MSNNMTEMDKFYEWLTNINSLDYHKKSVLIIGGSEITKQYALALQKLRVTKIKIISKTGNYLDKFCKQNNIENIKGGFENHLSSFGKEDLVIVATPLHLTMNAAENAIENHQDNILLEKPGSVYHDKLTSFEKSITSENIRVGYNRLVYPNLYKLKELVNLDGGITSCRFTFTERLSCIDFKKDIPEVYQRWGISNSLHVITMAMNLIGQPKKMFPLRFGKLDWHKTGSIFIGMGISENNIPFTYHADWGSGGRWGIEVNTSKNSYQLIPLEEIYYCPKDTGTWKSIDFKKSFPDVKQGIAEEVAIMLDDKKQYVSKLPSLKDAADFNILANRIFGYE